jgi:hypothetical protein
MGKASLDLDDALMRLSVLIGAGMVGVSVSSGAGAEEIGALPSNDVKDPEGRPINDPEQAQSQLQGQLQEFWESFASERLPVLRRLGIGPASPASAP